MGASVSHNKLDAKLEQTYWARHSSVNCRVIYASSISLIEVLDIPANCRCIMVRTAFPVASSSPSPSSRVT